MSGLFGPTAASPHPAELLQLLAAVGRLGAEVGGPGPAHAPAAPRAVCAASSAFAPFRAQQPSNNGHELLSALQFWLELYQIAQNGLKNAMAQVAAAYPSLAGGLAAMAPAQSPTASAALQLLSSVQSRNLGPQPLSAGHSDVSATTAVLAAAAGLGAASPPGMAPIPDVLLAAAGLLVGGGGGSGGGGAAARGASAGAAAPDSQGVGAGGRDWSVDPGASDGSQEPQLKRPRVEGGQPTGHRPGKVCSNCHTSNTPFWRKDRHTGLPLCNACGLYAAKNDHPRPVKLWREGQAGSPTQPPRQPPPPAHQAPPQPLQPQPTSQPPQQQEQQQRALMPAQPAVAHGPGPAQEQQGEEAPRPASPRSIAVAAAMQAVMRQAAAAQLLQQRQQQQQPASGSGSGSPQYCSSPAVPASQQAPQLPLQPQPQPQPQPLDDALIEARGSGSMHVARPARPPSPAAAAGEAAACSPPPAAPQEEGLNQGPSPYRQAAASLLAATMGVLAQS